MLMGEGELKILKAVFGKFERGVSGIPSNKPVYDVTEKLNRWFLRVCWKFL